MAFQQALVTQLAGNLEQVIEVAVELELVAADDVVGQCLGLGILTTVHADLGGKSHGCIGSGCAIVGGLVGTHLGAILNGVIQVLEHVALNGVPGRTGEIALVVVAQDGHVAKGLCEPVVGIGTQDAHLTAVGTVVCPVGITGDVLGIGV